MPICNPSAAAAVILQDLVDWLARRKREGDGQLA